MKRSQNRKKDDLRPISITNGFIQTAHGSTLIEWGKNKILCTATIADETPPWLEGKNQGWITAEYAMLPTATHQRKQRERKSLGGRTYEIQRLIGRSLRAVANLSELPEKTIYIDCDVLQADGGTRCASITGAYIALYQALKTEGLESALNDTLVAVSVGILKDEVLLDLDYNEDSQARVDMNFVVTGSKKFVEIQGTGEESTFSQEELSEMTSTALAGIEKVITVQKKYLK
ncbi:MAG: ribonuclease PH [Deltaproteobacteria bacterium]|nr:ribonuclease PH [Deltaproteobacteria bacterium]